jgi:uncharacterized membrane protein (UPF0127 family)
MIIIKIKGKEVEVELANSLLKQVRGLMFSKKKNLLFTMSSESYHSFWMFGVRFPIKMIFINSDFEIVDIHNAEPLTFNPKSWKIYKPKEKCKYILETADDLGLKIEDRVEIR